MEISTRASRHEDLEVDFCIVGGGLAGVCAAITAARAGLKVVLMQDRSVLGGNASSEVRLWALGATSHMGNNNRWAREGGVIDEILVENTWRNPEGNPVLFDVLLLDKVAAEPNITLFLDTVATEVTKKGPDAIASVRGFCALNGTSYEIFAPLFLDSTGDGLIGFLAGAAFRIGQEPRCEFGELYAPEKATSDLLGHSLYFTSKDAGRPVHFEAPAFALDIEQIRRIHRYRNFDAKSQACMFWWIEFGGHLDTIHDCSAIKWELWRVVYGVWNFIKNSGEFPDASNLTLEWVGQIPGKRESRRFEGDVMLIQQDLVEQRQHEDAVSFGGWAIDHHPVEGVYSEQPGCTQWHAKGVYQIPYRALYSRNINNLFLGGRIISASHIAFGSTRVMATSAHNAQAVGMAAALCIQKSLQPRELATPGNMLELKRQLSRSGQYIPGVPLPDPNDVAQHATVTASSALRLASLDSNGKTIKLECSRAMLLPLGEGPVPEVVFRADAKCDTTLRAELRISSKSGNFTPDVTLEVLDVRVEAGKHQAIPLRFESHLESAQYAFFCLFQNPDISLYLSDIRVTGILAVSQTFNKSVAVSGRQEPPSGCGIESFEFWLPQRRPRGENLAIEITPPLACFKSSNILNGFQRPTGGPNAWVAALEDKSPIVNMEWAEPQAIRQVEISFDSDFDHPMESVIMGHPERVMPSVITDFELRNENDILLAECRGNHQTRRIFQLAEGVKINALRIHVKSVAGEFPAAIMEVRCYC